MNRRQFLTSALVAVPVVTLGIPRLAEAKPSNIEGLRRACLNDLHIKRGEPTDTYITKNGFRYVTICNGIISPEGKSPVDKHLSEAELCRKTWDAIKLYVDAHRKLMGSGATLHWRKMPVLYKHFDFDTGRNAKVVMCRLVVSDGSPPGIGWDS